MVYPMDVQQNILYKQQVHPDFTLLSPRFNLKILTVSVFPIPINYALRNSVH